MSVCMHLCVSDDGRVCVSVRVPAVSLIKRHWVQRGLYIPASLPVCALPLIIMKY